MVDKITRIHIGGGQEAETKASQGWLVTTLGSDPQIRRRLNQNYHKPVIITGEDAHACIPIATLNALVLGVPSVTINLNEIKTHDEDDKPLQLRAQRLTHALSMYDVMEDRRLKVEPTDIWEEAKNKVRNNRRQLFP